MSESSSQQTTQERCSCGGTIIFDDERGVAYCSDCKSYEAYTTPELCEKAKTGQPQTTPAAMQALAQYLLSKEYRRLLRGAIAARLGTTQAHAPEHIKALDLFEAAFPEEIWNV